MNELVKVVHCKEKSYDVYIGRPSKWGNPYSHRERGGAKYKVETRDDAIEAYSKWVMQQPDLLKAIKDGELTGKTLGCWCKPKRCHGDILAELVLLWELCNAKGIGCTF